MALASLSGCTAETVDAVDGGGPESPGDTTAPVARVMVTRDCGAQVILDEFVVLDADMTSMEALESVADVGTAYGGGFVQSINGIGVEKERRSDWFYAVNGILADRGATDHALAAGDVEQWDYRTWSFRRNVTATLGCWPAFFLNGYEDEVRPTAVAFESCFSAEASAVAAALRAAGVPSVDVIDISSLPRDWREYRNLVVIAGSSHDMVREVYGRWDRLGLFTVLDERGVHVFTAGGDEAETYVDGTGVIDAVQNPWNPSGTGACEAVVLLLSGTDDAAVRSAVEALLEAGDTLMIWCGAVVRDGFAVPSPAPTA